VTWKTVVGVVVVALIVWAIDSLVGGLSHAAVLALGTVGGIIVMVLTTPDAGGLREPREH
jgi:hypothetical protein